MSEIKNKEAFERWFKGFEEGYYKLPHDYGELKSFARRTWLVCEEYCDSDISKVKARLGSIPDCKLEEIKKVSHSVHNLITQDFPRLIDYIERTMK